MAFQLDNEIFSHLSKSTSWEQSSGAFYCFDETVKYEVIIITVSYLPFLWQEKVKQNIFQNGKLDKSFSLSCAPSI
jgi:hypothetical protein